MSSMCGKKKPPLKKKDINIAFPRESMKDWGDKAIARKLKKGKVVFTESFWDDYYFHVMNNHSLISAVCAHPRNPNSRTSRFLTLSAVFFFSLFFACLTVVVLADSSPTMILVFQHIIGPGLNAVVPDFSLLISSCSCVVGRKGQKSCSRCLICIVGCLAGACNVGMMLTAMIVMIIVMALNGYGSVIGATVGVAVLSSLEGFIFELGKEMYNISPFLVPGGYYLTRKAELKFIQKNYGYVPGMLKNGLQVDDMEAERAKDLSDTTPDVENDLGANLILTEDEDLTYSSSDDEYAVLTKQPEPTGPIKEPEPLPYPDEHKWHNSWCSRFFAFSSDCCLALFCPCVAVAHIAAKLKEVGGHDASICCGLFGCCGLFYLGFYYVLFAGFALTVTTGPIFLVPFTLIATCQLRGLIRKRAGISGNFISDFCSSFFWPCTLTQMMGTLWSKPAEEPGCNLCTDFTLENDTEAETDTDYLIPYNGDKNWHHGLFERHLSFEADCWLAYFCPFVLLAQISSRLKALGSASCCVCTFYPMIFIGGCFYLYGFYMGATPFMVFMVWTMRGLVRRRLGIHGNCVFDLCSASLCGPCTLIQMMGTLWKDPADLPGCAWEDRTSKLP